VTLTRGGSPLALAFSIQALRSTAPWWRFWIVKISDCQVTFPHDAKAG
jgi:hypothetical protein